MLYLFLASDFQMNHFIEKYIRVTVIYVGTGGMKMRKVQADSTLKGSQKSKQPDNNNKSFETLKTMIHDPLVSSRLKFLWNWMHF